MPDPTPWDDDRNDRLRAMAADGASVRAMAAEMGCSPSTLQRHLNGLGIRGGGDRSQTIAATQAKVIDAKARRADLALRFLAEAHAELDELHKPHLAYSFGGKDNVYTEHPFDRPPVEARERIMRTAGTAALRHVDLVKFDADQGATVVIGLLQQTAAALGLTDATDAQPPATPPA